MSIAELREESVGFSLVIMIEAAFYCIADLYVRLERAGTDVKERERTITPLQIVGPALRREC